MAKKLEGLKVNLDKARCAGAVWLMLQSCAGTEGVAYARGIATMTRVEIRCKSVKRRKCTTVSWRSVSTT